MRKTWIVIANNGTDAVSFYRQCKTRREALEHCVSYLKDTKRSDWKITQSLTTGKVTFNINFLTGIRKYGSELEVGKSFIGELWPDGNIYWTDAAGCEWVFYPDNYEITYGPNLITQEVATEI